MKNIPVYILSLNYRTDRQNRISNELRGIKVDFTFVISTKEQNKVFDDLPEANQTEVAIWFSHVKAMKSLLASDSEWGLILEDDAIFKDVPRKLFETQIYKFIDILGQEFGIIQLGWIPNSKKKSVRAISAKGLQLILGLNRFDFNSKIKFIVSFGYKKYRKLSQQLSRETKEIVIPLLGMRLGTHAYLINKNTAQKLVDRFQNRRDIRGFSTIDQDLLKLTSRVNNVNEIKAVRFSRCLIQQSQEDSDNTVKTLY